MKKNTPKLISSAVILLTALLTAQPVVSNHTCTVLDAVPYSWIDLAKTECRIWYGHTSHGSQITTGMGTVFDLYGDQYGYSSSGADGYLSYQETGGDLGHNGSLAWESATRTQLDNPSNDRNVVMWSWCGGCSDNTEAGINTYLEAMNQLEADYPDVQFIYMTGHLDGSGVNGNLHARNQQIRDFCLANDKILFDFADIESFDPDGNGYLELFANDNCDYNGGNWAQEWCGSHPDSDLCEPCGCAHSQPLNCNLKGRAFWWMLAEMLSRTHAPVLADGDTNFDDSLDVLDIILVINFILNASEPTVFEETAADVNSDGDINVLDVVSIVGIILTLNQ